MTWKIVKGQPWACRQRGRGRGRGSLCLLMLGVFLCLLLPLLTPHPNPAGAHISLRRIHQEEEDYTGPKPPPQEAKIENPSLVSPIVRSSYSERGLVTSRVSVSSQSTATLKDQSQPTIAIPRDQGKVFSKPVATQPQLRVTDVDIPRVKAEKERAQEAAYHALQHGYKLTEKQKKLVQDLTPLERKKMEERLAKARMAQDRVYLTHLRARRQVIPRRGGGEQIVSTANRTVRFPALLRKTPLEQWPQQYQLYYNLTHFPWVKSRGCESFSITFSPPNTLPQGGLASFPSSGNTWIRYLIEGATGLFTGSMYADTSLMNKGMYGEGLVQDSGMTILQKSHGYTTGDAMTIQDRTQKAQHNHLRELGYRGVVVVRNPFKALISHRHLDVGGHTGFAPKTHFVGQGWSEFVRLKVKLWRDFYEDWLRLTKPSDVYITHYENVRGDPVREMRRILNFLNLPEDNARLVCLGKNLDGLFKRKPKRNFELNFDPFTEELRSVIYEAIYTVDNALRENQKEGLPLDKYEIFDVLEAEAVGWKFGEGED